MIPSDPVIGCECTVCYPGTSCCSEKAGASLAYTKHGKLRLQVGQPIYECNKACPCGPDCFNRVVQKGRKVSDAGQSGQSGLRDGEPVKSGQSKLPR